MIELAPHNPNGLALRTPVIIAPGCAAALPDPDPALIGAIATQRATFGTPQSAAAIPPPRWGELPAGLVLARLPMLPLRRLLQSEARRWTRLPLPVLVSLCGTAAELVAMVAQLDEVEGPAAVIVEVDAPPAEQAAALAALRAQTLLPLLAHCDVPEQAAALVHAGADALIVAGYPRGCGLAGEELVEGVILGPATVGRTLLLLRHTRAQVAVPLVALGGIADARLARACLQAGASAVMIDAAFFGMPDAPRRIALELSRNMANAADSA
nr:nitronate monooxygenase [Kallotenue papyrolyticum]